ncbi:MAG: tetraacyldisaccharide 4'-kinase [Prevotella sp.]|nr:tetraacyldisaccharide 4'-kinase [Prevotella sp.]MBQ8488113.1 tetraacyldisaccharide 4'-kinase [Prevotella sp.]
MEGDFIRINRWLLPLSWLYGIGVGFRNFLFEVGLLKSHDYKTPVISVGNITVGGTGKTPHVEYLVRLLQDKMRVAVLSRGYKRKSRGFVMATSETPMKQIGDEPYQMKQKFPRVTVAVDRKRTRGIKILEESDDAADVILLDDAFQHRYVKPGINILLVDYHRLIIYDKLLPAGRLREPLKGKDRADIVIVTKCPKNLKPMEFRVITKAMSLYPYQHLYFSTLEYEPLRAVFHAATKSQLEEENVLLLTGIASPRQMTEDLTPLAKSITPLTFADHHNFSRKDVAKLNEAFAMMPSPKCIITTEKDAARLTMVEGLSEEVRRNLFMLPVRISFMLDQEEAFNDNIIGYIKKNSKNSILTKRMDDHKTNNKTETSKPRTISFR